MFNCSKPKIGRLCSITDRWTYSSSFDVRKMMFEFVRCSIKWCLTHHYFVPFKGTKLFLILQGHILLFSYFRTKKGQKRLNTLYYSHSQTFWYSLSHNWGTFKQDRTYYKFFIRIEKLSKSSLYQYNTGTQSKNEKCL